jgi:parvulin-like peptidyl-prolyl isomerase
VHQDLVENQLLVQKLREDYFAEQVPTSAHQWHVMVMLLENEVASANVTARLDAGESFAELAGELSLNPYSRSQEGDFGWLPESILRNTFNTGDTADLIMSAGVGNVSGTYDEEVYKGVGYWLVKVVSRDLEAEEADVHAMFLGSADEAVEVRDSLEEGEDFGDLAAEFSQLPGAEDDRGNLGTIIEGEYPNVFDEYVFAEGTELGTVSQPIRDETVSTQGGYWLFKVVDEDNNRPLSEDHRSTLVEEAMNEWISSLWDNPDYEIDDSYLTENPENKAWAVQKVAG